MADGPASLIEKYYGMRTHYIDTGKAFDSKIVKPVIIQMHMEAEYARRSARGPSAVGGIQTITRPTELDNIPDEFIPESPDRARAIRFDNREALAELAEAKSAASAAVAAQRSENVEMEMLRRQLAEQQAKIAELEAAAKPSVAQRKAATKAAAQAAAEAPDALPFEDAAAPDLPTSSWTRPQVLEWAERNSIEIPADLRAAGTSAQVLDYVLGEAEKAA